jgi:hypothetical protein
VKPSLGQKAGWLVMAVLSIGVGLYALAYLVHRGALAPPPVHDNRAGLVVLVAHASLAALAMVTGPWQFLTRMRMRNRALHRWMGRIYILACLVGACLGAALAWGTTAGPIAEWGFMGLAVCWFTATSLAWLKIRQADYAAHRNWMIRSFALTLAAVTLRLYLPAPSLFHIEFVEAYRAIAWLCWVPNLIVAEVVIRVTDQATAARMAARTPAVRAG